MHCWEKLSRHILKLSMLVIVMSSHAAEIKLLSSHATQHNDSYYVDAHFQVQLDPIHEEALFDGIPLTFSIEFVLTQPRWYWLYSSIANWFAPTATIDYRLSYHALTRQYRLSIGHLYQSFQSLNDALQALGIVRHWQVLKRSDLSARLLNSKFGGDIRMRLNVDKLPKLLQLSLSSQNDWELQSDAHQLIFSELQNSP